jgi:hypothetical protein
MRFLRFPSVKWVGINQLLTIIRTSWIMSAFKKQRTWLFLAHMCCSNQQIVRPSSPCRGLIYYAGFGTAHMSQLMKFIYFPTLLFIRIPNTIVAPPGPRPELGKNFINFIFFGTVYTQRLNGRVCVLSDRMENLKGPKTYQIWKCYILSSFIFRSPFRKRDTFVEFWLEAESFPTATSHIFLSYFMHEVDLILSSQFWAHILKRIQNILFLSFTLVVPSHPIYIHSNILAIFISIHTKSPTVFGFGAATYFLKTSTKYSWCGHRFW